MILENVHDTNIGLLKLKIGDIIYVHNEMWDVGGLTSWHIILSIEKLDTKSNYSTYKLYEFFTNRIHTYALVPNHPWPALQHIIRNDY